MKLLRWMLLVLLARFTALSIFLKAPVVYLRLHKPEFALGDLVQGSLLLVPALLVGRHTDTP